MIYCDTDFIINSIVVQDETKHKMARELIDDLIEKRALALSLLSLQEMSFVLAKLKISNEIILDNINFFFKYEPFVYNNSHFQRAVTLAKKIGFYEISDCIHTAIAEDYCEELITFNKKDFKKIQKDTDLKIRIL